MAFRAGLKEIEAEIVQIERVVTDATMYCTNKAEMQAILDTPQCMWLLHHLDLLREQQAQIVWGAEPI